MTDADSGGKRELPAGFFGGNEPVEEAIAAFNEDRTPERAFAVLEAIGNRMEEDGQFLYPVYRNEDEEGYQMMAVEAEDGSYLQAAFTSVEEYRKGQPGELISNYIDVLLEAAADSGDGYIINPWGQYFVLPADLIAIILKRGEEKKKAERQLTPQDLEDGSMLKEAIHTFAGHRTRRNLLRVLELLRDSLVWIPCNAVLSEADQEAVEKQVREAEASGDSMVGKELVNQEAIRLVPDILKKGEEYFFPVFTTMEDMGEYGDHFSKSQNHFLEALALAKNNEKNVSGIVINAFSEAFVLKRELFETVKELESGFKAGGEER